MVYDLEERTFRFTKRCRDFIRTLPRSTSNFEYVKQLIRSSASIGANNIEANESLSNKDYYYRVRICRKEAKETIYWLLLIDIGTNINEHAFLVTECDELKRIFGAIISKSEKTEVVD